MILINFETDPGVEKELSDRLVDFNEQQVGPRNTLSFVLSVRDDTGKLVAGLTGETFWNALYVHVLWVHAQRRKNGYGKALIGRAEQIARERGCDVSMLSTFSFQAPVFYAKLGYETFGEIANLPPGHRRYWFSKRLIPDRPCS
jgi:GNAT superfamily N-acetyltransferase